MVRLNDEINVLPILFDYIIHCWSVPIGRHCVLLLGEIDPEFVLRGGGAALFVDIPSVSLIAAADDAELAGDIVLFGVRWDDREPTDMALECHGSALQHVRKAAVKKFIDAIGVNIALGVDPQLVLGQVRSCLPPNLLTAILAIKTRVVTGTVERFV